MINLFWVIHKFVSFSQIIQKNHLAVQILEFFLLEMTLHTISLQEPKFKVKFTFCCFVVKKQRWVVLSHETVTWLASSKTQPNKKFDVLDTISNSLFTILVITSTKEDLFLLVWISIWPYPFDTNACEFLSALMFCSSSVNKNSWEPNCCTTCPSVLPFSQYIRYFEMIWPSLRILKFEQKRNIWTSGTQFSLQKKSFFFTLTKFQLQKLHKIQPYESVLAQFG